ncbi:MAG: glycyl-radical enzyme activating protein [Bacillota bacterium]
MVFDIQRYSLGDGAGIRTTVFLKGCALRCRWCQNPESLRSQPEMAFRRDRCIGCGSCVDGCPRGAIRLGDGHRIDPALCDGCGACAGRCPTKALFLIGRPYTVTELLDEVQRDAIFHAESGGGVTLSGGEPTLQYAFTNAFLRACRAIGLNTAIETCGHTDGRRLSTLLPLLDQVYFDLKLISPEEHRRQTGRENDRILQNAELVIKSGLPVTFRVPLVPGITDPPGNLDGLGRFLRRLGVSEVELCPYHESWERKLSWLHTPQVPLRLPPLSPHRLERAIAAFASSGIRARLAGG